MLYRESDSALKALITDSRRATLRVIATAALEIGLDRLAGGLPVHINFPRELLAGGDTVLPLHPERVVIQVFDDLPATREVIEALRAMRARAVARSRSATSPPATAIAPCSTVADIVKSRCRANKAPDLHARCRS